MSTNGNATDPRPVLVMLAAGMATRYGGGCKPLAPVGFHGEAVIDLTAGDARAAGFGEIVVIVGPQSSPAITYHLQRSWPASVKVSTAEQPVPLGTAHAVLCARRNIGDRPFAVVNGDDVYGVPALRLLADHLALDSAVHANVAFALRDTIVTRDTVTRGTCQVDSEGNLAAMVERKKVHLLDDGRYVSDDGLEPAELAGDTPVSMNLWGLRPSIWPVLVDAVTTMHPTVGADGSVPDRDSVDASKEVLLPEVVNDMTRAGHQVAVLAGPGRCIGVTHLDDLPVVCALLAQMVAEGERPENPWPQDRA